MLKLPSVGIRTTGAITASGVRFTTLCRSRSRAWCADTLLTYCRLTLHVVLTAWLTYLSRPWIVIFSWGRILNPWLYIGVPWFIIRSTSLYIGWPGLIVSVLIPVYRWILWTIRWGRVASGSWIPAVYICPYIDRWVVSTWTVLDTLISVSRIVKCPDWSASGSGCISLYGRAGLHRTAIPVEFKITFIPYIGIPVTERTFRLSYS